MRMRRTMKEKESKMAEKKKNMLLQGGILAAAGLVTKVIGFAYRIPMTNFLGEEGNGLYSVASGIYAIALTISSYSLPLAVSKMVSTRVAKGEYKNVRRVVADAMVYAIIVGVLAMNFLFFGSGFIEKIYHRPGLARPLQILAPTTFIVALLGVFRGYFQGYGDMVPTSISQIIEQIFNAAVSVVAVRQCVRIYKGSADVASYGAAGGTLGTLAGAASALIFIVYLFYKTRSRYQRRRRRGEPRERAESNRAIYRGLFFTIIPVILSQTIYQISYTIDDLLFGNLMALQGYADKVVSSLQGVYNTQYNQLVNLPVAIATAMAASTLPSIVVSHMQHDVRAVHKKITSVIKVNMVIAFPSAVGLAVLSDPIMRMLFPTLETYRPQAVTLMAVGSSAVVFYALSTLTTSILQGNNYMRLPVIHSAISLGIHIILIGILLGFTDLNVYALVICNVIFPIIVSVLNCQSITEKVGYQWEFTNTFFKPFIASLIMGAVAFGVYRGLHFVTHGIVFPAVTAIVAAVIVYAVTILQIRCFSAEELRTVPGGRKLERFLR